MGTEVFISHHTESSSHIVEAIANKLESKGVACWYAPRDVENDYAGSIMHAIKECTIFLLILNHPASESAHVLNELNAITERIAKKENVMILPFHIADDEISDEARYYIGRMNWLDAMTPPMFQRVDELSDKIINLLGKAGVATRSMSSNVGTEGCKYKLISRIPDARDIFFGRDDLIEDIHEHYTLGDHVLFLEGIGGIGKSELAKQYYIKYREDYDDVLFLTYQTDLCNMICDDNTLLIDGISRRQDETVREYFVRKMKAFQSAATKRTLLIIDNFDVDKDPDMKTITSSNCDIIFTTRNAHPGYKTVKVESIQDKNVLHQIFESHYGDSIEESDLEYLDKMIEMVDYHTYALELIAKQMTASFLDFEEMYHILLNGNLDAIADESVEGRTDSKNAFAHICSLFNVFGLHDDQKQILRELSLMGLDGIPAPMFKKWAGLNNFEEVNKLIKNSWIRKGQGQKLSLHPLIIEVVHSELKPDMSNCRDFLMNIASYCYFAWYHPYKDNLKVFSSVQYLLKYFAPFKGEHFDLVAPCVPFMWIMGDYDAGILYGHKLVESCEKYFGENDIRTAYSCYVLGGCYYNCRRGEESVPWYHKAVEKMKGQETEYTLDLAMFYEKSARCYGWAWGTDYEKSQEYFDKARQLRKKAVEDIENGKTVPSVAVCASNDLNKANYEYRKTIMENGRMYQLKGDYEYALKCILKYKEYIDFLSNEDRAYIYLDYGLCKMHLGLDKIKTSDKESGKADLEESVENLKKALEINLSSHGDMAMDTIECQEYVGDAYVYLGKYSEASNAYMAVLSMLIKVYGSESDKLDKIKRKMDFTKEFPEEERKLFL